MTFYKNEKKKIWDRLRFIAKSAISSALLLKTWKLILLAKSTQRKQNIISTRSNLAYSLIPCNTTIYELGKFQSAVEWGTRISKSARLFIRNVTITNPTLKSLFIARVQTNPKKNERSFEISQEKNPIETELETKALFQINGLE